MRIDLANLPHDTDLLHRLVRDLVAQKEHRDSEIDKLRLIIRQLQRSQFGRRSERLDPDQMHLGFEDLDADIARAEAKRPAPTVQEGPPSEKSKRSAFFPESLPRHDVTLNIEGCACPKCGGAIHEIGVTTSEMLDWVPASVRVIRINRPKHGCRSCGSIHQAPAPERLIAKGMATPGLIAQVLVSKYCDHLPLYRQAQIFARHGIELDRSTLANWVGGACWWLEPLHELLAKDVFASSKLFADDTPMPVLDPGRGKTKTGRLWVYARDDRPWTGRDPPAAVYFYSPDRRGERPAAHLSGFSGVLQVDGYAGFERLTTNGTIVLAACWAHVRRKFFEFHKATGSPIAAEALRRIAAIYKVEEQISGQPALERVVIRERDSRTIVEALKLWLEHELSRVPPKGGLADAIAYALNRWPALCRFLEDGRIELDNNAVERAIRPIALGRKNHLFAGSDGGAERWAIVCSLIATAKLNGVEPFAYLKDVLERLAAGHPMSRLGELLPWKWTPKSPVN
jgi:transposase